MIKFEIRPYHDFQTKERERKQGFGKFERERDSAEELALGESRLENLPIDGES